MLCTHIQALRKYYFLLDGYIYLMISLNFFLNVFQNQMKPIYGILKEQRVISKNLEYVFKDFSDFSDISC